MRGYQQFSRDERVKLEQWRAEQVSGRQIARRLGRQPSSVSRELRRNGSAAGSYQAASAQQRAQQRPRGQPRCLIRPPSAAEPQGSPQWQFFQEQLVQGDLSPQLLAGRFRLEQPGLSLSGETVYRYIYHPRQREQRLWRLLHRQHARRRKRSARAQVRAAATRGPGIRLRPAAAAARREVGHWEGDLLCFSRPGAVVLHLVERLSRFRFALKLAGKHSAGLMQRLSAALRSLPSILRETLTVDNGSEFACWPRLREELGMAVYFCDPYAAWQKGTLEALNGVLRRYLPRSTDLRLVEQEELTEICEGLNDRPMAVLGYRTPREVLHSELGLTVALHV